MTNGSDFFYLFGNGTHTGSIGKNSVVSPPIGEKIAPIDLYERLEMSSTNTMNKKKIIISNLNLE